MNPPKPASRADKVSLWRYVRLFRQDILSAQPEKLYRAKMAEFRTPFFRSYFINQPDLIREVLDERPMDFPKSDRVGAGLRPLLGNAVFLTNGARWQRQRRIINPAFEGGRLRDSYRGMRDAVDATVERLQRQTGPVEMEEVISFGAADVIFRTLFSMPISDQVAAQVFAEFRRFQRSQPILNLAAFVPLPRWFPRFRRKATRQSARRIRGLIAEMTSARMAQIKAGTAPDDLATKIMTQADPETGQKFDVDEMVDQVAIFFLAGHETSAAAVSWALYLLASHPGIQDRVAAEVASLPARPDMADIMKLTLTRDVFREALRLYPPVPMMVRQTTRAERFRGRDIAKGSQVVISPWHLQRNPDIWDNPDGFDPDRYGAEGAAASLRDGFVPFSSGARVCPGVGFALVEGAIFLALMVRANKFTVVKGRVPVPVSHLTVRSRSGIWLNISERK
ncbi:MAG: cytochrome P450 [Paracoccaceae bacterium]